MTDLTAVSTFGWFQSDTPQDALVFTSTFGWYGDLVSVTGPVTGEVFIFPLNITKDIIYVTKDACI